jgi:CheY-like chemotaxis protein
MAPKLLLADDSVTIQRVIELTFADEDVQVLTAGDGEQAIARVQADRPDIVLADIGMPKRSGYDVAAFIKGQPELAHIPVLLLTGAFEPVDEGRAQAVRCDGVLVKPFEPQHVIARVRELLQHAKSRPTLPSGSTARAVSDVPRPVERLAPQRGVDPSGRAEEGMPARAQTAETRDAEVNDFDFMAPSEEPRGAAPDSLDDYFDRLDAAFANISPASPAPSAPAAGPADRAEAMPRTEAPATNPASSFEWLPANMARPATLDVPAPVPAPPQPPPIEPAEAPAEMSSYPVAPPAVSAPQSAAPHVWPAPPTQVSPEAVAAPPVQAPPSHEPHATHAGSAIADAFSALLAVEQGEAGAAPLRLAAGSHAPAVTDELIDEIARRVIERLGAGPFRDIVTDVVSRIAERLVREEIDRIRSLGGGR